MQSANAARQGKGKLRARAQTGMCGNGLQHIHRVRTMTRERSFHLLQVLLDTLSFRAGNVGILCAPDAKAGPKVADGKSDAAELTAQSTVEIKETEMQPGGNGNGNLSWS